ncbi:MAG: hypothetical protein Devi2KO_15020 [Devosia indica]
MSMFVTFPYEDRIEMLTDGACYNKRGTLFMASEKVWRSPDCPMMVTGRGNAKMVRELAKACLGFAQCGSFAQAIRDIELHFDEWRERNGEYQGQTFQMLIAGWHEDTGFSQFHVVSHANWIPGMEPMRVNTVWGVFWAGPPIDPIKANPILTEERVKAGATVFGPELAQLARETPMQQWESGMILHSVGCHIDHTVLTRHGVETKRLLKWPDKRLQKIDPDLKPEILLAPEPKVSALDLRPPHWIVEQGRAA